MSPFLERRNRIKAPALAVLLSGAMWFASSGVNHFWPLAWLAPLPLLVVLPDLHVSRAALAAFVGSAIGALNLVVAYSRLPPVIVGGVVTLVAGQFTVVALIWREIARRGRPAVAIVAYPALIVSAEYIASLASPHGTFGSLAYSQADVPTVIQLASVIGLSGISFVVSLVPAALAVIWRHRHAPRVAIAGLALAAVPLALTLAFGAFRLAAPTPPHQVRVGLAANDAAVRHFATRDRAEALEVIRAYAQRVVALADQGAQVIVLPEKFVGIAPHYADEARAILAAVARERRVLIVAGFNFVDEPESRNVAVVFGPDGNIPLEYDKTHLVPGLEEGYRAGTAIGLLEVGDRLAGVAICKDLDFVPLGRAYARSGIGLMLVPAWDFVNDGWIHSRMAVLRGVEGGYAMARSATNGFATVSDAQGRIVAERSSSEAADVLVAAVVTVSPGGTFYTRNGDWFAWLCIAVVFVSIVGRQRGTPNAATPAARL
jgi:apolipoprotein N-acyltransferase